MRAQHKTTKMPIDYKRYPPNWKSYIVPTVLARANNCCEKCGLKNGQGVWSVPFVVRTEGGRYKQKAVWFSSHNDAIRESEGRLFSRVKVVLTIAHLDHDEENHSVKLERLMALCQICHLRYDAQEKYRRSISTAQDNNTEV